MGDKSKIEWTDSTWNPVRGCSRVSHGCEHCYAERQAHRQNHPGGAYEGLTRMTEHGPVWTGEIRLVPELLDRPLRWKRPRRIFVNSMSDLFHENMPDSFIDQVFAVMKKTPQHTFQILTKRPQRMSDYCRAQYSTVWKHWPPLPNVWLGVSVENQATAEERILLLLQTPAAVHWVSAEPLLGPIDITNKGIKNGYSFSTATIQGHPVEWTDPGDKFIGLDWLVVGGESGPHARPMHPAWARSLRDQCQTAAVPFFFKQWGEWMPVCSTDEKTYVLDQRNFVRRVGKKTAGRLLDGREWNEYPRIAG